MPALLCVLPPPKGGYQQRRLFQWIGVILDWVSGFTKRRRLPIFVTAVTVLIAAVTIGVTHSRISVFYLKELPQDTPGMKGLKLLADHLVGTIATSVTVNGKPDTMQDPKVIKALQQLDNWAEKQDIVKSSLSPADIVGELHRAFNGGDLSFRKVPDDRNLISQYLAILDPHTRSDFVTDDYARTHLRILSVDVGSWQWHKKLFEPLKARAKKLLGNFKLEFTGYAPAAYSGQEELVVEMLEGFVVGFLAIAFLVAVAFRSVRLAALAILPNLLPTAVCLATLAAAGVTLRTGTTMFLCVAVGITFDNTIHLFSAVRDARARGLTHDEAIDEALGAVGPPIIYTSMLIAAGFGIFVLSDFELLRAFGLTCVGVVIVATLADLLFTVSLVRLMGRSSLRARGRENGEYSDRAAVKAE
jgi:predicted RND superfamily exporter protein